MTVIRCRLIYCDGENCPQKSVPLGASDQMTMTAQEQLRGEGWLTAKGGKHYCPDCRKEQQHD